MKMMLSVLAATLLVSGVFSQGFAAEHDAPVATGTHQTGDAGEHSGKVNTSGDNHEATAHDSHNAHGGDDHGAHGGGHHKEIGIKQPVADLSLSQRPAKVTLEAPKALSKVKVGAVTLSWKAVEGAESYHVQVATDPRFKWFVSNENFVKGESFQTPALEAGTYFWRVAAKKPGNMAGYTTGFFTMSSFDAE